MTTALWLLAIFLFVNILVGLGRVLRGPTTEDRLATVMLFGTTGVAMLLVLAQVMDQPVVRDIALVFVSLAALVVVVFGEARRTAGVRESSPSDEAGDATP